jgi:hypothetical protein
MSTGIKTLIVKFKDYRYYPSLNNTHTFANIAVKLDGKVVL